MAFKYTLESKKDYGSISIEGSLLSGYDGKEMLEVVDKDLKIHKNFVVDMSRLNHLSSEGFNVLLHILTKSRNLGGETVLCNLSTHIQSLFIITKLSNIFTIVKDKKEATAHFKNNA